MENAEVLQLEEGDRVRVSARETEMEVIEVGETPTGGTEFTLENRYGQYQIRDYGDGDPVLYRPDRYLEGVVEVEKVE